MVLTLNQVVNRIKSLALAHRQIRNFYFGNVVEFLTDKTTRYPSCFLQDSPGSVDLSGNVLTYNFKIFLLDLVHVSEDTKANEQDVQSDTTSIGLDLIAEMNSSVYTDLRLGTSIPVTLTREELDDLVAGVMIDISIQVPYDADACAVPTNEPIITEDMSKVYDVKYEATGKEGNTLTTNGPDSNIPELFGKKILFATREMLPMYEVSQAPEANEFTWNNSEIGLNTPTSPPVDGKPERFLFLYRDY